ncbi:serine hydrolase domain-containing protein [Steroidobacter flavus]|uniref:Serine hydrolase domain-containing protein n=1 Tax=Steroidobacter flavus TaxID=1842136 RepID=A0ABV8SL87_9GAMM
MRRLASLSSLGLLLTAGHASALELGKMAPADLARLKARTVCSCVFVQRMSLEQCADGRSAIWRYASPDPAPPLLTSNKQRLDITRTVDGGWVQLLEGERVLAQSRYLADGGGCVTQTTVQAPPPSTNATPAESPDSDPLPRATVPAGVDTKQLDAILTEGFSATGPLQGFARAAVVVSGGRVVADRYAPGYSAHNLFYVGSIAKTQNNLLAGLLVREGKLQVKEAVNLPEWRKSGDARGKITYDDLLKMVSGLSWDEQFWAPGDNGYELFFGGAGSMDEQRYMTARTLEAQPGTHFEYSTGAATLLGGLLQAKIGAGTRAPLLKTLHEQLLEPIGARQFVTEFDPAGNFTPGHTLFIGAEDLARIGFLFANDGVWNGQRILPEGWVAYSTQPALASAPDYGAQLMLNMAGVSGCFGHQGVGSSFLVVCPQRDLVLVWLNSVFNFTGAVAFDAPVTLLRRVITSFPERATP